MMNNKKLKFGFIGCGRVSKSHFTAIKENSQDLDMQVVCDVNTECANLAAKKFNTQAVYSINDLCNFKDLDFVTIATPNGEHAQNALELIQRGFNVVIEKPMALSIKDGIKMVEAAKQNNVKIFIIQQNRYNKTVQLLHKAIREKRFGRIYMVIVNVLWHRDQEYYDTSAPWHGTKDIDGGAFFTQASHYIDLMQWMVNDQISSVYADLKTLARRIETEDTGSAIISWKNGTIGSINMTVLANKENFEGSITVLGEHGTVRIDGIALNKISTWQFDDEKPEDKDILSANYSPDSVYGSGHILYYKNVINTIRGLEEPLVDGNEGLASLRILSDIYESAGLKKPIVYSL